jgi:hypothetical protein
MAGRRKAKRKAPGWFEQEIVVGGIQSHAIDQ